MGKLNYVEIIVKFTNYSLFLYVKQINKIMGKPFNKELEKIQETFSWSLNLPIGNFKKELQENLSKPIFIVGSGGSLSACYFATILYQQYGMMAKAITPLELIYSKKALSGSNIMFISASGKNNDIVLGYESAIEYEPHRIYNLCMQKDSLLSKLSKKHSVSETFEYSLPTGKDGFLATNSLVAFFSILYSALTVKTAIKPLEIGLNIDVESSIDAFVNQIKPDFTFLTLYGGWGLPVAIDLESKFAEAALADISISDYRNFGHGRHHWLDKRSKNSAIIAIITPEEENLADKTLALLPKSIPVLKLISTYEDGLSSIDLLMQSFYLVQQLGKLQNIDPGRPGVPDYGSKLYNLQYKNLLKKDKIELSHKELIAIKRKTNYTDYSNLSSEEQIYWTKAQKKFKKEIEKTEYGAIVLDYDGTLCSGSERYNGINTNIAEYLNKILENGLVVGIATGRGKSVRIDLQNKIDEKYWSNVIVGYYNCSDIGILTDNSTPNKNEKVNDDLTTIFQELNNYVFPLPVKSELRPHQITIEINDKKDWHKVRDILVQLIMSYNQLDIQVIESSHSMDIISKKQGSKLNIIGYCNKLTNELSLPKNCLSIGDKGKWPGNDYQLLSTNYSLSVDEVSHLAESCWNFAAPGIKNIEAMLYYLSCLKFENNKLTIEFK
ncbi:hypothetical protein GCM10028808_57450 [Spirosoma migulaei]